MRDSANRLNRPLNPNCRGSSRSKMSTIIPVEPPKSPSPQPSRAELRSSRPRKARGRGRRGAEAARCDHFFRHDVKFNCQTATARIAVSLPGSTRQSITFEMLSRRSMDARIIPDQVEDGRPGMTNVLASRTRLRDLANGFARVLQERPAPERSRAQGKPDARCTRGLVCKMRRKTHTSIQVQRRQSGFPCAVVLRLITRSPRRPGFLATVVRDRLRT